MAFAALLWPLTPFGAQPGDSKPFVSTAVDFGHLVNGEQQGIEERGLPLNRNTVKLGVVSPLGENWSLKSGFKSILWWPFGGGGNQPHERIVRVEATLEALAFAGNWGREGNAGLQVKAGYFPYKYNADAVNLGEYLHRSGTYPGYLLTTENWELMNGATPYFYGAHLRFTHFEGLLEHDLTLFMETETNPIGDLTPGYGISLQWGILKLGGGISLNHYLSWHPTQLKPRTDANTLIFLGDTVTAAGDTIPAYSGLLTNAPPNIRRAVRDSAVSPRREYLTHRGIKLMGLAALDFGGFFPEGVLGPRDLRVFAETAVLGVEDQPYFYEDISQRIPVMLGVNLPAFQLLDVLCVQLQYYGTPYNNYGSYNNLSLPQWTDNQQKFHRDDFKWSVYARRTINRIFRVHLQVANDHLRTLRYDRIKSDIPLTQTPEHWYYLIKLEMGV